MNAKSLSVKITQCTGAPEAWYAELIGQVVEVYKDTSDYILREDYDRGHEAIWHHIPFADAEAISAPVLIDAYKDLASPACRCGRQKKPYKTMCYACWKRLSPQLQKQLYNTDGYPETYRRALVALDLL